MVVPSDADEVLEAESRTWWVYLVTGALWIIFGFVVLSVSVTNAKRNGIVTCPGPPAGPRMTRPSTPIRMLTMLPATAPVPEYG